MNAKLVIDSSWHWIHAAANSSKSCWSKDVCHDPLSCWQACAIEGVSTDQWIKNYGVSVTGDALTIGYVTGNNIGSRMYLAEASGLKYAGINMLAR